MLDLKNKKECSGCSACKNICPKNAITMCEDEQKFLYPNINHNLCIDCGLCEKVCPILNRIEEDIETLPKAYAGYNKDEKIRSRSSSGGVFSEIAKVILSREGIVFGASFDKNFDVCHIAVDNENDLEKLCGSKYVQSDIKETYKEARQFLEAGRIVLFTGTPCQIEGLYNFLNKDYENLYTQDLICHGVPSKIVWEKYIKFRKKQDEENEIKDIFFRDKSQEGWSNYELSFKYDDKVTRINHSKDLFMKLFLSDIVLRPSCYDCKFKKKKRRSDITLADFWGIDSVMPELNDEKGTSLIIVSSCKGEKLLEDISSKIISKKVDFEKAISSNPSMTTSANIEKYRPDFYRNCETLDIEELVNKYIKE